jgi:hypothetical protein
MFSALFREVSLFADATSAKSAPGLAAIFEPRIEQFSFATAQETGGNYFAVTIKYRIVLTTAAGEPVDAFTLTGYGNSLAGGMSSGAPLMRAAQAATRQPSFWCSFRSRRWRSNLRRQSHWWRRRVRVLLRQKIRSKPCRSRSLKAS